MTQQECEKLRADNIELIDTDFIQLNSGNTLRMQRMDIMPETSNPEQSVIQCVLQNTSFPHLLTVEQLSLILEGKFYHRK